MARRPPRQWAFPEHSPTFVWMANEANHDENSDPDYIAFDLE